MPAKELGTKHVCWKCGTKFYDLKRSAPVCPKCGADPRQTPAPSQERKARPPPKVEPVEEVEVGEDDLEKDLEEGPEEDVVEADDE